jgi:hypothetical protein
VLGGARDQFVVAVIVVFPALVELAAVRTKLSALEERFNVIVPLVHPSFVQNRSTVSKTPTCTEVDFLWPNGPLEVVASLSCEPDSGRTWSFVTEATSNCSRGNPGLATLLM